MGGGQHERGEEHTGHHADLEQLAAGLLLALLEQVVRTHSDAHQRTHDEQGEHRVGVTGQRGGVERRGEEVGHDRLGAGGRLDQLVAGRRLHPGVGDDDPQGRQARARPHQPRAGQVKPARDAAVAEEQHAQEHRLEEEREQRLSGQRRAEDVAHEARVVGPVGAERELHGDAGSHTHGKRPREQA